VWSRPQSTEYNQTARESVFSVQCNVRDQRSPRTRSPERRETAPIHVRNLESDIGVRSRQLRTHTSDAHPRSGGPQTTMDKLNQSMVKRLEGRSGCHILHRPGRASDMPECRRDAHEAAEPLLSGCRVPCCRQVICRAVGHCQAHCQVPLSETSCQVLSVLSGAARCLSDRRGALVLSGAVGAVGCCCQTLSELSVPPSYGVITPAAAAAWGAQVAACRRRPRRRHRRRRPPPPRRRRHIL